MITGLREKIIVALTRRPGLSERELAAETHGPGSAQQLVNGECRRMVKLGFIERRREDGVNRNYLVDATDQRISEFLAPRAKPSPPPNVLAGLPPRAPNNFTQHSQRMNIGGYEFEYVCAIEPIKDHHGAVRRFLPQCRYAKKAQLSLHAYGAGPFCEFKITAGLRASGVYALLLVSKIKRIGRCGPRGLSWRFNSGYGKIQHANCFRGGQEPNCRINNLIKNNFLDLWFFPTPKFAEIEVELIGRFSPPWNR